MYSIVDAQGNILTTGTTLYTVPADKSSTIVNLTINNPTLVAYDVAFYKVISSISILMFAVTLDAGDFINDDTPLILNSGTSLYATSSDDNTVFTLNGNEVDLISIV